VPNTVSAIARDAKTGFVFLGVSVRVARGAAQCGAAAQTA
jgi:hypothetical protein